MPHEVKSPAKAPSGKKPPLGIPKWGWIAAAVLGLIIGYMIVKKSGGSSTSSSGSNGASGSSPLGNSDSGSGGGVVASPPPDLSQLFSELAALGLIHGSGSDPGSVSPVGSLGDNQVQSQATIDSQSPQTVAEATAPVPSDPSISPAVTPSLGTTYVDTPPGYFSELPSQPDPGVPYDVYIPYVDVPNQSGTTTPTPVTQVTDPSAGNVHTPGAQI